jgi:hypothetical protein
LALYEVFMTVSFSISLGVVAHSDDYWDSEEISMDHSPELTFASCEAAADWLEKLAGEDPGDPIRAYANRVRRKGPRVARKLERLMSRRPAW